MELQRFDVRGEQWGLVERTDGLGAFCYYDDADWYRKQYIMALFLNIAIVIACILLSAYLVYHKHDPQPMVKQSVSSTNELSQLTEKLDQLIATHQKEKAVAVRMEAIQKKKDEDSAKRMAFLEDKLRAANALITKSQQAEVLTASRVPDADIVQLAKEVGFNKIRVQP